MNAINNKKNNTLARKVQQRLINQAPIRAHTEIFEESDAQSRADLQAIKYPKSCSTKLSQPSKHRYLKIYFKDS
jgi:hypothetical protein